jgi:hypothetical protein
MKNETSLFNIDRRNLMPIDRKDLKGETQKVTDLQLLEYNRTQITLRNVTLIKEVLKKNGINEEYFQNNNMEEAYKGDKEKEYLFEYSLDFDNDKNILIKY